MTEYNYCCDDFEIHATQECGVIHPERLDCPDTILHLYEFGVGEPARWGIPIHDGGHSFIRIQYCPWCGKNLAIQEKINDGSIIWED